MVKYPLRRPDSIFDIPGLRQGIQALENARKETFELWMDRLRLDAVVFPANGDVGAANADCDEVASRFAWSNGVKYSNGNRPIRHLGVPTISVPMGVMEDIGMPVNLTFAGKAYDDNSLLKYGFAFEKAMKGRVQPSSVPTLDSDFVKTAHGLHASISSSPPDLLVHSQSKRVEDSMVVINIKGSIVCNGSELESLSCYINGQPFNIVSDDDRWLTVASHPVSDHGQSWKRWSSPALAQDIAIITARTKSGSTAGKLILL